LFNEHKAVEASSRRRLKAYREAYLEFKCESPSVTLDDSFNTSIFNHHEVGPSGKA
jgi:hypothetical protein